MSKVPHRIPAEQFIDWVNFHTRDEAKRCRILLAEVILRLEEIKPTEVCWDCRQSPDNLCAHHRVQKEAA